MKPFLFLILLLLVTDLATAAPYVVYSGSSFNGSLTSSGTTRTSYSLVLIVDAGDTSNYALLQVNTSTKAGTISGYPIANATSEQSNENFFGGITASNARNGSLAIFTSGSSTVDSSNNTYLTRSYGTGSLNPRSFVLVAARKKPLVVSVRNNGVVGTPVTYPASVAISLDALTAPYGISGVVFDYTIASTGSLTQAATSGNFSFNENAALTTLANIGGGYSVGRNTFAIDPVTVADDGTVTDALTDWLTTFATDNNYSVPVTNDVAVGVTGGTLSVGNSSSGGMTLTGTGTTIIGGSNSFGGDTEVTGGSLVLAGTSGTLSLTNNSETGSTTTSGGTFNVETGTTTGTLTLTGVTINSGTLSLTGTTAAQ